MEKDKMTSTECIKYLEFRQNLAIIAIQQIFYLGNTFSKERCYKVAEIIAGIEDLVHDTAQDLNSITRVAKYEEYLQIMSEIEPEIFKILGVEDKKTPEIRKKEEVKKEIKREVKNERRSYKKPRVRVDRFSYTGNTTLFIDGLILENIEYIHIDALLNETEKTVVGKQKMVKKEVMGYEVALKTYVPIDRVEINDY